MTFKTVPAASLAQNVGRNSTVGVELMKAFNFLKNNPNEAVVFQEDLKSPSRATYYNKVFQKNSATAKAVSRKVKETGLYNIYIVLDK